MTKQLTGPIEDEKAVAPGAQREIEQSLSSATVFQEIFIAKGEKPAVPISARIPPSLDRLIEELVLHPAIPYRTKSDFFKDAVFKVARGLTVYLKVKGFDIGKLMPFLSKLETLQLEAERHLALKRTVDAMADVNESVGLYIQEEAWNDLLDMLEEYARILNEMSDGFYKQLAILKFFTQSNVAEALRAFRAKKVNFPSNLKVAEMRFRGLRK